MGQDRSFEIIRPSNRLRAKVTVGQGHSLATIVADAEAAIEVLGENFPVWVRDDIERLEAALREVRSRSARRARAVDCIFDIAHNMKGQGATFGYPLVGAIAASLCRFIEADPIGCAAHADVIEAHVDALRAVIANEVTGDGGEIGRELIRTLEKVVATHLGSRG